jgi:serine/arginine repetitive matrix protein 1
MASGVDAKLLKSTKFPPEYSKKVDMSKVNVEVMKQWIATRVVEILANEDDVVIDFVMGMLEESKFVRHHPPLPFLRFRSGLTSPLTC